MDQLSVNNNLNLPENGDETKIVDVTFQYIVIRLGDEQYGIDISYVNNIVRMQRITRVPKVAAYLKGVINLRGEVLPVVSLRLKMGLAEDVFDKATRIIILKTENEGQIGILVDEVKEVVTLSEKSIEKVSHDSKNEKANFLSGVGKNNGELISILDLNMITLEDN
ncbi:MAG: purine-binding chemotaxis protein CheW [Lachnospiraceae bacterium]|nr:purine-binding chemotaxis protein CheW [Lachnospiraceae bacterium]